MPLALIAAGMLVAGLTLGIALRRPTPPPTVAETKPAPVDLSPLHFSPDERPANYVWAQPDKVLPKNPLPARSPDELDQLATYLAAAGLQNLSPADLKQGYAAVWFRGAAAFVALETPIAERLEKEFLALKDHSSYRWTHRKGALLVLAWAAAKDSRAVFDQLVGMAQKKLGLPVEAPRLKLDDLKWTRDDLSSGWSMEERPDFLGQAAPGAQAAWRAVLNRGEEPPSVAVGLFDYKDAKEAEAAEKTLAGLAGARRVDVFRVGPVVAAVALLGREGSVFAKVGESLRDRMGLPSWSFDHLVPRASELPEGFAVAQAQTDPAAILKDVALVKVQASDVARAWRARFTPAGTALILEIKDYEVRNSVESQVRKVGPGWRMSDFVVSVEGPDDETLDALENCLREKCGWDRNSPRPLKLQHVKRLTAAELPAGYELGPWTDGLPGSGGWELKTPQGQTLRLTASETTNYAALRQMITALPVTPGDLLLVQNFVVVHAAAPEAAWPALDALEPALRKRMRMEPAGVEDLPDGFTKDGKWMRLWGELTRERAQIRKMAEDAGLDPAAVAAARYDRHEGSPIVFELRQPPAAAPTPKPGWQIVRGSGRFVAAIAEPVNPLIREAVRGIMRGPK